MQVKVTNSSKTEVKFLISAQTADLTPIKDQVVARLSKNVKLPGFRSGKAPKAMIEKNLDQSLLQSDFLDEAMTQLYAKATKDNDVRPATRPEVSIKKFVPFTELEFEITTGVIGKIELPSYSKIKVNAEIPKVSAKDVDGVIDSLRTRLAEKKPVERAAKKDDEVLIDFVGKDLKGEAIESADGKDYPLLLGSNAFIPGFEDSVIGMKANEEKTFPVTFPKDYGASNLAGAKVNFTVKVKVVNELVQPAVDDKFAAKIGPFKDIAELKTDIKKQLTAEKEQQMRADLQEEVLKAVTDQSKVEIPEALINEQVAHNLEHAKRDAVQKGQTFQELLDAEGKTEDEFKKQLEPGATEQLKASLILAEIADVEKMQITAEELDGRIQVLKTQYRDEAMQAELDKPENRRDIASRMLSEKVVNFLIDKVTK